VGDNGWDRHRCISWTLEWIHPDGSRDLRQCRETSSVEAAYAEFDRRSKRRRLSAAGDEQSEGASPRVDAGGETETKTVLQNHQDRITPSNVADAVATHGTSPAAAACLDPTPPVGAGLAQEPARSRHATVTVAEARAANDEPCSDEPFSSIGGLRFHLLFPRGPKRLIPLPPEATLSDCLRGATVLEFPTIRVLDGATVALPTGFTLAAAKPVASVAVDDASRAAHATGRLSASAASERGAAEVAENDRVDPADDDNGSRRGEMLST